MGQCYADVEQLQAIHKTYLRRIRPERHFRLSAHRTRLLQQSLTRYFGRPNSYDCHSDSVLRAALQKSLKHKTKMRSGAARGGHSRAGK
jgi:hypothetical protein